MEEEERGREQMIEMRERFRRVLYTFLVCERSVVRMHSKVEETGHVSCVTQTEARALTFMGRFHCTLMAAGPAPPSVLPQPFLVLTLGTGSSCRCGFPQGGVDVCAF